MSTVLTTLIIGAGASKEVGLPIGSQLKDKIAKLLDIRYDGGITRSSGCAEIDTAFRKVAQENGTRDINPFLHACWRIRDAMPQAISIDNFIDAHAGDPELELSGKLGITKAILDAEKNSKLFLDRNSHPQMVKFGNIQDSWFNKFFQLLTENCRIHDIPERLSRVKIISFNYDRCVAHYLLYALQNYFGINENEAAELMQNLEIFHPYGKVGSLPWQNEGGPSISFGGTASGQDLLNISSQIRTFTEGTDPEKSEIISLRESLVQANRIIFLGFAYHKINMGLLASKQDKAGPVSAHGTAKGMSKIDGDIVANEVRGIVGKVVNEVSIRHDLTCSKLFDEYWRTLSMS